MNKYLNIYLHIYIYTHIYIHIRIHTDAYSHTCSIHAYIIMITNTYTGILTTISLTVFAWKHPQCVEASGRRGDHGGRCALC